MEQLTDKSKKRKNNSKQETTNNKQETPNAIPIKANKFFIFSFLVFQYFKFAEPI